MAVLRPLPLRSAVVQVFIPQLIDVERLFYFCSLHVTEIHSQQVNGFKPAH